MKALPAGARLELGDASTCELTASAGGPALRAAVVTRDAGQPTITAVDGERTWTLPLPGGDAPATILLYVRDETEPGRVEDRGPVGCRIGSEAFSLDTRADRHGCVIVAEIYRRNGRRMLRVRGDGHGFGIQAYARREGLPVEPFLPARPHSRPRFDDAPPAQGRAPRGGLNQVGTGSGVIVAPGYIVTNVHVVDGARAVGVTGPDGEDEARIVALDPDHDLALLRTGAIGGSPVPIRQAGTLWLGEEIIAAGYPLRDVLGDDLKITHGNVSGMKGPGGDVAAFQFTAPIASGSSGGAVTDRAGALVGIVTSALAHDAMRGRGAISENVNFAVKSSLVLEMLAAHGIEPRLAGPAQAEAAAVSRAIRASVVSITNLR